MLKALELSGFKSFADETRFDFPAGITVVVGPNGSGKSNIVDAIKWVLGAQSAKALRGKEMADVIFKGSGNGQRKPANTAEATIIFENVDNIFGVDTEEVRVTRRVYRSGEGEYLINNQACRLRDIKDMFRGTGVGADAYSLIEQGKVDSLLEASAKDRRAIFEEAAGISRFKAKKVEAQRRLERVEQNLLRLSDIVDEVDHRLNRLKSQAQKARRYQEYSERLQSLRTHVGRVDWHRLSSMLAESEAALTGFQSELGDGSSELEEMESLALELDARNAAAQEQLRECDALVSRVREKIAAGQSTIAAERKRCTELNDQLDRLRHQMRAMTSRAGDMQSRWQSARQELDAAEEAHDARRNVVQQAELALKEADDALAEARRRKEAQHAEQIQQMQAASALNQKIVAQQSVIDASSSLVDRTESRLQNLAEALQSAVDSATSLSAQLQTIQEDASQVGERLKEIERTCARAESEYQEKNEHVIALRQRHAVIGERIALLEEIEQRMEGIGSGVKKLLKMKESGSDGTLSAVRGMVADLVKVRQQEDAEMVAVALGERAQHLVIAGIPFIDALASGKFQVPGRVGFVRLQSSPPPQFLREVELDGQIGVIGRADRFVEVATEYEHLVQWLLGDTWFVESLDDAVQLHRSLTIPPRLVTRIGEVLERDGRLIVGPHALELGLIPRRAELESLGKKHAAVAQELADSTEELNQSKGALAELKTQRDEIASNNNRLDRDSAHLRLEYEAATKRRDELQNDHDALKTEIESAQRAASSAASLLATAQSEWNAIRSVISQLEAALQSDQNEVGQWEQTRTAKHAVLTTAKIELAKSEQHFDALRIRSEQLKRDQDERKQAIVDVQTQTLQAHQRQAEAERNVLRMTSEIAQQYLELEQNQSQSHGLIVTLEDARKRKQEHTLHLNACRDRMRRIEIKMHECEMQVGRLRQERSGLAERLNEDYGIEVAHLNAAITDDEHPERDEVGEEISELRRKISNIGSVNMESLEELQDLESRYNALSTQYQDLVDAKESLERIIHKINADSRRLFAETLEAIRVNFQVLFRKVFGGGHADIVLEQDVDILESGIDVVAQPPGKNSLGLQLLSGGERALTAVALLMAIFEYRPSPFCVLDEVDAPLDDSNIGRFAGVLREFLEWTKFVIVTHNKETMTAANTLYGITMQESGVSKRVSVRFEDVNDKGEIRQSAVDRAAS